MLIPVASPGSSFTLTRTPLVSDFGLGDNKTIARAVEGAVSPLVSAKLLVKSDPADVDANAVISKAITTSATSAGQITDDGTTDMVGALQFELAQSETALLVGAKYYTIAVSDAASNTYITERGVMLAGVPVADPNARAKTVNWNLNVASIEPPTGGSRLLVSELINDLDQGEVYSFTRKIQGVVPVGWTIVNLVFTVRRAGTDPDGSAIVTKTVTPGAISLDATYPVAIAFTAVDTAKFVGAMVWDAKLSITNGSVTKRYTVAIGTVNAAGPLPAVGTVLPAVATMAIGTPPTVTFIPLQLALTMADISSNPINPATRTVAWGSSNKLIATVSQSGLVTAVSAGSCDIVATSEGVETRATVTVQAAVFSVTVTPNPIQVSAGLTVATTTVLKDAGNNVLTGRAITYTSSNPSIATVDPVTGVVTGVGLGTANIIVQSENIIATVPTTTVARVASVTVTPNPLSITAGHTQAMTAVLRDASSNVLTGRTIAWDTSDHTKATVDGAGVVTAITAGSVNVTATSEGITGTSTGTVASGTAIPPYDTGNNVWAFDPDGSGSGQYVAGPTGTVTTPTKTSGTPSFYTFGSTDRIDFGDALDPTWIGSPAKFTLYFAIAPTAGDIAAATAMIAHKDNGTTAREWVCFLAAGKPQFVAFAAANGSSAITNRVTTGAITAAKHVIAISIDASAGLATRTQIYVDGVVPSLGSDAGTLGATVIIDTGAALRLGQRADGLAPVTVESYSYAYAGAHSPTVVGQITSWIQATKGWT